MPSQTNMIGSRSRLGEYTYIPALFGSLIISNLLQSIGTLINWRWVVDHGVSPGKLCSAQGVLATISRLHILVLTAALGGIKQAGNLGTAVWWAEDFHGNGTLGSPRTLQVVFPRVTRLPPPVLAGPCEKANQVVCTHPRMVPHRFRRLHWPSCDSEGRPRPLLRTFRILVCRIVTCCISSLSPVKRCWITHQYYVEQTVLEYLVVSSDLLGGHSPTMHTMDFRSGRPLSPASCFTWRFSFAFVGTSSRTAKANGICAGSRAVKAGNLHLRGIISTRAP